MTFKERKNLLIIKGIAGNYRVPFFEIWMKDPHNKNTVAFKTMDMCIDIENHIIAILGGKHWDIDGPFHEDGDHEIVGELTESERLIIYSGETIAVTFEELKESIQKLSYPGKSRIKQMLKIFK